MQTRRADRRYELTDGQQPPKTRPGPQRTQGSAQQLSRLEWVCHQSGTDRVFINHREHYVWQASWTQSTQQLVIVTHSVTWFTETPGRCLSWQAGFISHLYMLHCTVQISCLKGTGLRNTFICLLAESCQSSAGYHSLAQWQGRDGNGKNAQEIVNELQFVLHIFLFMFRKLTLGS